jgi:hypothetical protein
LHDPEAFRAFGAVFGSPKMPVPVETDVWDRKKRAARKVIVVAAPSAASSKDKELENDKEKEEMLEEALDWREASIAW